MYSSHFNASSSISLIDGNLNFPARKCASHMLLISVVNKIAGLSAYPSIARFGIRGWMHSLQLKHSCYALYIYIYIYICIDGSIVYTWNYSYSGLKYINSFTIETIAKGFQMKDDPNIFGLIIWYYIYLTCNLKYSNRSAR